MRKIGIVDLIFFVTAVLVLVYSIITKNGIGIMIMSFYSIFYLIRLIYDLVEPRIRQKRLEKEAKENGLVTFKIDNLPKTNFDKITESVESLAEYIEKSQLCPDTIHLGNENLLSECKVYKDTGTCKDCIKEWLQKECEE